MINIIVAMTSEGVIGKGDSIPWCIPQELERFKKITTGHTIVMGRKTFQSIGKLLPFRDNIVVTKTIPFIKGAEVSKTIPEALKKAEECGKKIFIIGGGSIYAQTLPFAKKLYVSWIHENYKGDQYFPALNWNEWSVKEVRKHKEFTFKLYERNISALKL